MSIDLPDGVRAQSCRSCGGELSEVLSLGEMPLANALLDAQDEPEDRFPLDLAFCSSCSLAQLFTTVPPEKLFVDYPYFSSNSETMLAHSRDLVAQLVTDLALDENDFVMEVASNDGYLLKNYVERAIPCLGIEPAKNVASAAQQGGIPTMPTFFSTDTARSLKSAGRLASVIHANNVLAHVPSIDDFVTAFRLALREDGHVVIETPYVRDLVEGSQFDTIYHEHVFYYSLRSLSYLLAAHDIHVYDVERIPIHGGSLRVFGSPERRSPSSETKQLLAEEEELGLDTRDYYLALSDAMEEALQALRLVLDQHIQEGRSVAAYGAAAKGAILLNLLGAETTEHIKFVADRSPVKQGRFMPGVRLPIVHPDELTLRSPDIVLLLTWNFADEILAQQHEFRERGGRFLIPLPSPRLV